MLQSWPESINRLPLTPSEQQMIQRFRAQAGGRNFLAVAELLLKYGVRDDAIQLLLQGIQAHPSYSVARVVLVKELFTQGMAQEAWQILENSPSSLRENKTAQILKFKLAIILDHRDFIPILRQEMLQRDQFDHSSRELADQLDGEDLGSIRYRYLNELLAQGIPIPQNLVKSAQRFASKVMEPGELDDEVDYADGDDSQADAALATQRRVDAFFVTPLHQVFTKPAQPLPGLAKQDMDAMTLAQIYRRQGHFQKSLDILKRLLYMAPNNDLLRKQVVELRSLKEEQERREREHDPELADRMEQVAQLDQQIRGLTGLLEGLDHYDAKKDF